MIDLEAIWRSEVAKAPFEYFVAENALSTADLMDVQTDFPRIDAPGTFPLRVLDYGPAFQRLVAQLRTRDLMYVVGKKFHINLTRKPMYVSVRSRSRPSDGRIHRDSRSKVVSCVLFLNDDREEAAGRLRMLASRRSFASPLAEISPRGGTLVAIRRSDRSWHGYLPYEGPRRCVIFHWMWSRAAREWETIRHRLSARTKRNIRSARRLAV